MKNMVENLEDRIGYEFKDKNLLIQAMTLCRYQKLEYFGDAVLLMTCIMNQLNRYTEPCGNGFQCSRKLGELHDEKISVVKNSALAVISENLELDRHILTGKPARLVKGFKPSMKTKADIVESILGAIFIDSGMNIEKCLDAFLKMSTGKIVRGKGVLKYIESAGWAA